MIDKQPPVAAPAPAARPGTTREGAYGRTAQRTTTTTLMERGLLKSVHDDRAVFLHAQ